MTDGFELRWGKGGRWMMRLFKLTPCMSRRKSLSSYTVLVWWGKAVSFALGMSSMKAERNLVAFPIVTFRGALVK